MIEFKKATVKKIEKTDEYLQEVYLEIEHPCKRAYNYIQMTGLAKPGDVVLANTTACTLNLGTGGYHYVMANFSIDTSKELAEHGHGMKLKYTPNQINFYFLKNRYFA